MRGVAVLRVEPEVERQERETQPFVLLGMPELVSPERVGRLARDDDDVSERDRGVAATREHQMREAAVAHIQEAAVAEARAREREPAENMSDRIGMVGDELLRDPIARCYRRPPAPPRSPAWRS
jgi:hypothetical protein